MSIASNNPGMAEPTHEHQPEEPNPLQGYFDWQVTTLMLAHDLMDPIARGDEDAAARRRQEVEGDVRQMVMAVLPDRYKQNPQLDWPREVMTAITRATLHRARDIADNSS